MNDPGSAEAKFFLFELELNGSEVVSARSFPFAFSDLAGVGAEIGGSAFLVTAGALEFLLFVLVDPFLAPSPSYLTSTVGFLYGAGRPPFWPDVLPLPCLPILFVVVTSYVSW